jgi:hypothetical protein
MASQKIETADSAAKKIIKNAQPAVTFNGFDGLEHPALPTPEPLPPALAKALGQTKAPTAG